MLATALALVNGAPAWAADLRLSPAGGPAGSKVTVTGTGFAATEVQIRWGGESGRLLDTALGPDFSLTAVVPDAPPGSYEVVAVAPDDSVPASGATYQLTAEGQPVEATTTTSPPQAEHGTGSGRSVGVTGGLDPSASDTGDAAPVLPGAVVSTTAPGAAPKATADTAVPGTGVAVAAPPEGNATTSSVAAVGISGDRASPPVPSDQAASTPSDQTDAKVPLVRGRQIGLALGPTATSQSSGAVRSPGLLFAGLGMIVGGVAFLAMRNSAARRVRASPTLRDP